MQNEKRKVQNCKYEINGSCKKLKIVIEFD